MALAAFARAPQLAADTTVPGGTLGADTTWIAAASPYLVQGSLTVAGGVRLTIEPGVIVRFATSTSLLVYGTVVAEGTAGQVIAFTSAAATPQRGDWGGVEVAAGGAARLLNFDLGFSGGGGAALRLRSSEVTIQGARIHDNQGDGVYLEGAGLHPVLARVRVESNLAAAVRQSEAGMAPAYSDLTCSGNGQDGVVINGGWMSRDGTLDGSAMATPFLADGLGVGAGTTLTLTPGTTLRFRTGGGSSQVYGALLAEGTPGRPITFGSDAATPQPGDWYAIEIMASGSARLAWCDIGYAGLNGYAALRVYSSGVTLESCTLHDNRGDGVYLDGAGLHPVLRSVRAERNGAAAVRQSEAGMAPLYSNLSFAGNGLDGVVINDGWMSRDGTLDGFSLAQPFIVDGRLGVGGGMTLTITAGTTVRFRTGGGSSEVYGTLLAEGTASRPITIDSDAATPQRGDWYGIAIERGGTARFAHCELGHAGLDGGAVLRLYSSAVSVLSCTVHDNRGDGISLSGSGLRPTITQVRLERNGGAAIRQREPGMSPVYRGLVLAGNNPDAIAVEGGALGSSATWDTSAAGADIHLLDVVTVPASQLLQLVAGTTVRAAPGARIDVSGALYALGTAEKPIKLTAVSESPGGWPGVRVYAGASAILDHCELAYGGWSHEPLLWLSSPVAVHNCRVHHSAADGIRVTGVRPVIAGNQIAGNAFGLRNTTPDTVVDARNNWWGDASGPTHASNPAGRGDAVSDGVLFDPWQHEPGELQVPASDLVVKVGGPARVSPGETVEYAVFYSNQRADAVDDAVLVLALPGLGSFVDATGGGIYWPQLHQVFWRLGELSPGTTATVSARVEYRWGLPDGLKEGALALLGGANLPADALDPAPYLAYQPLVPTAETDLSAAELAAERAAHPDLDQLLTRATGDGFVQMQARRVSLSDGRQITRVTLGRPGAVVQVERDGATSLAQTYDSTSYSVQDTSGGMRYDHATGMTVYSGSWGGGAGGSAARVAASGLDIGDCMRNTFLRRSLSSLTRKAAFLVMTLQGHLPACGICFTTGEPADCARCAANSFRKVMDREQTTNLVVDAIAQCSVNPNGSRCSSAVSVCFPASFSPFMELHGGDYRTLFACQDGVYRLAGSPEPCDPGETCKNKVEGELKTIQGECANCGGAAAPSPQAAAPLGGPWEPAASASLCTPTSCGCSAVATTVQQAHDPNEKAGPAGDVVPGQLLEYAVSYENEGQGRAYGVYVLDTLSPDLDEATLTLDGPGTYIAATREILWDIGELAAGGEAGSQGEVGFSVRARQGLASGTVITNQAVVYFPSVPEETPTNTVVNVVAPLSATPQSLATTYAQPIAITLAGRDVSGLPLTFAIAAEPSGGELTGTPPQLTYTPAAGFTGLDTFTFTVANGVSVSRPAAVEITVDSSPADTDPPAVLWTYPAAGSTLSAIAVDPVLSDAAGPIYAPSLLVQLSEAADPATIGSTTVEVRDGSGRKALVSTGFDRATNEVTITLREHWQRTTYTVKLGTGIEDLAGNPLAAPYSFTFAAQPPWLPRHRLHSLP